MKYEKFYDVCKELEAKGERFTEDSLKRISYRNLRMAFIGNAGKARCEDWDLYEKEEKRRLDQIKSYLVDDVIKDKGTWNILDDMSMFYDYMRSMVTEKYVSENAPQWRLLVHYMHKLRGDWSDGRDSHYLEMIYKLIPKTVEENIIPQGWLLAVKNNADTFDGHFNDGRIMRDGELLGGVSGNLAKSMGLLPLKQDSGFYGGYEELFETILNPEQMIQYLTPIEDLEDDY